MSNDLYLWSLRAIDREISAFEYINGWRIALN